MGFLKMNYFLLLMEKGKRSHFQNLSAKAGLTYKISGRHMLNFNGGYLTKAPTIRNTFANSRSNNDIIPNLKSEKITSGDASYIIRMPYFKSVFLVITHNSKMLWKLPFSMQMVWHWML